MDTSDGVAPPPVAVEQEVSGAALAGGVPVAPSPAPSDDTTPSEVESDSMQVAVGMSEHAYSSASKPSISKPASFLKQNLVTAQEKDALCIIDAQMNFFNIWWCRLTEIQNEYAVT